MRFWSFLMMVAGALIALTTGLCSLIAAVSLVAFLSGSPGGLGTGDMRALLPLAMPAIGFAISGFGAWMFRRGWERARADAAER